MAKGGIKRQWEESVSSIFIRGPTTMEGPIHDLRQSLELYPQTQDNKHFVRCWTIYCFFIFVIFLMFCFPFVISSKSLKNE